MNGNAVVGPDPWCPPRLFPCLGGQGLTNVAHIAADHAPADAPVQSVEAVIGTTAQPIVRAQTTDLPFDADAPAVPPVPPALLLPSPLRRGRCAPGRDDQGPHPCVPR